jgi:chemotaxis protein CheX
VPVEIDTHQAEIVSIVEDVFRTMLDLEVSPSDVISPASGSLTVAVQFVGEWKGAVLLECGSEQAIAFTARLMPGLTPSHIDEDVRDSVGELVNMVGGNLKSVLPPGVALSMPSVVVGGDYAVHICGDNAARTLGFTSEIGPFWVTLLRPRDSSASR